MASICGKLTADINKDCANPLQAGTRDQMKVLNLSDIATLTRSATTGAIEALTNTVPGSAVVIDGQRNSIVPRFEKTTSGPFSKFKHEVACLGFDISPEIKFDLENGIDGQYVAIVQNFHKGDDGETAFEIYGLDNGMELSELSRDPNSEDTQGAFAIKFMSEINTEPRMPAYLFEMDYATTKAIYDAL